ncbi:hypothetical protein NKG94_50430 [Micromonospora sp. M12]
MDGSQKLPQRLVGTVRDRRRQGDLPAYAALAIAAWMRFTMGVADDGQPLPLQDPLADVIRAALPHSIDPSRPLTGSAGGAVRALLRLDAIFPTELAEDAELVAAITGWLDALSTNGAAATVKACTW